MSWALRSPLLRSGGFDCFALHDWSGLKSQKVNGSTSKQTEFKARSKAKRPKLLTPEIFQKLRSEGEEICRISSAKRFEAQRPEVQSASAGLL